MRFVLLSCAFFVLLAVPSSADATPAGTTLLTFNVARAPLAPSVNVLSCASERAVSVVSNPTSPTVKVIDANDSMRWVVRIKDGSMEVTTRSGLTGKMRITYRDQATLRAIADEGVAESFVLDYRSGRGVFTTTRNLLLDEDNELLARVHYMACAPVVTK